MKGLTNELTRTLTINTYRNEANEFGFTREGYTELVNKVKEYEKEEKIKIEDEVVYIYYLLFSNINSLKETGTTNIHTLINLYRRRFYSSYLSAKEEYNYLSINYRRALNFLIREGYVRVFVEREEGVYKVNRFTKKIENKTIFFYQVREDGLKVRGNNKDILTVDRLDEIVIMKGCGNDIDEFNRSIKEVLSISF